MLFPSDGKSISHDDQESTCEAEIQDIHECCIPDEKDSRFVVASLNTFIRIKRNFSI